MVFNLLFDSGSPALTVCKPQYWVTNKEQANSFKNYKA